MPYGWEGNRRSGVALAMRHRLQWFIHLLAQWPVANAAVHRKDQTQHDPNHGLTQATSTSTDSPANSGTDERRVIDVSHWLIVSIHDLHQTTVGFL